MKAAFGVEAIGYGMERETLALVGGRRYRGMVSMMPWLAELTGRDAKYGYARRFLPYKVDHRQSSSTANRGTWFWWTLETGRYYQARYRTTWDGGMDRHFLRVSDDGDVTEVDREEVEAWLNEVSASTS